MNYQNPYFASIDNLTRRELKALRAKLKEQRKQRRAAWWKHHRNAAICTKAIALTAVAYAAIILLFLFA